MSGPAVRTRRVVATLGWLLLGAFASGAGYRNDTGVYVNARPPAVFSATQGVLWKAPLPSWSNASPVILGDKVCTMVEPTRVTCVSAVTGREVWSATNDVVDALPEDKRAPVVAVLTALKALDAQVPAWMAEQSLLRRQMRASDDPLLPKRVSEISTQLIAVEKMRVANAAYLTPENRESVGYTMPTPWTDGRVLYVHVGNGVVSRFEADGRRTWTRWLGAASSDFRGWYLRGGASAVASPRVVDGVLVVAHGGLHGLDPATGAERWTVEHYTDFGTPAVARVGADALLITPDGRAVRARDGRVMATGLGDTYFSGPYVVGDRVWFAGGHGLGNDGVVQGLGMRALRLVPDGPDAVKVVVLWTAPLLPGQRTYASPLVVDDKLWVIQESDTIQVFNASTGAVVSTLNVSGDHPGGYYSSPVAAGGAVWFAQEGGRIQEVRLSATGTLTTTTHVLDGLRSTPVFEGERVYVRTFSALWAFGR